MRTLLFCLLGLTLLAIAFSHHGNDEEHLLDSLLDSYVNGDDDQTEDSINNYIDKLLSKFLEKVRTILKAKEPYKIPDLGTKEITDKNVQANITLTNVKEYNASTFVVNKLSNSMFRMTEVFDISFPTLHIEGDYEISGKVLSKAVNGKGHLNVWMTNLHTWGKAYACIRKGSVQIKKLNVDYTVDTVTAKVTGLIVEGLTQEEVDNLLSTALKQYFTDNERVVSDTIASKVTDEANTFLQGKSLSDLISWLKHFITPPLRLF